jgi:RNA polymerase sigma factor for flagellar operon FliA
MNDPTVCEVTGTEIKKFMPLVHHIVAAMLRRLPPNVLRDDLVAAGMFGLLDALRRQAATERGAEFSWYARVRIRGAILDELRAQDWLSRRTRRRFASEGMAGPGSSASRTCPKTAATWPTRTPTRPSRSRALARKPTRSRKPSCLPIRERNIITARYYEGAQSRAVARDLGVSEPRVSQLHSRAITRLREYLAV